MSLPQHMRAEDPVDADPARRRLLQKSTFPRFPSLHSRPSNLSLDTLPVHPPDSDQPTEDIVIDDTRLPHLCDDKDVYRWAVLYENQRGITLFSKPFYSSLSLFPSDPQPFTAPNGHILLYPNLSPDNYPLPDGTWRWVSSAWMIDMRTDHGEVQHDGFEYNWSFRGKDWHAKIGRLSAGAWVRRRRWIRLMMRPAHHARPHDGDHTPTPSFPSLASSLSLADLQHHASHVWDGSEQDWQHVHRLLKQLGRDGRKLELWRMWLGPFADTLAPDIKGKAKQPDDPTLSPQNPLEKRPVDVVPEGNLPQLVHLAAIVRNHGEAMLHSFVFPDSRAQFVGLVRQAGLVKDLESSLGRTFSSADIDFWSYASNLNKPLDAD